MLVTAAGKHTLRGIFVLSDITSVTGDWDDCEGIDGYDDFDEGVRVSITNAEGDLVGAASTVNLTEDHLPVLVEMDRSADVLGLEGESDEDMLREARGFLVDLEGFMCVLYWEAQVEDADFYSIDIGRRGSQNYPKAELEEADWNVAFSLGL